MRRSSAGESALASLSLTIVPSTFRHATACTRIAPTIISNGESAGHHSCGPYAASSRSKTPAIKARWDTGPLGTGRSTARLSCMDVCPAFVDETGVLSASPKAQPVYGIGLLVAPDPKAITDKLSTLHFRFREQRITGRRQLIRNIREGVTTPTIDEWVELKPGRRSITNTQALHPTSCRRMLARIFRNLGVSSNRRFAAGLCPVRLEGSARLLQGVGQHSGETRSNHILEESTGHCRR